MFDGFLNTPLAFAGKMLESIEIKEHGHKMGRKLSTNTQVLTRVFFG